MKMDSENEENECLDDDSSDNSGQLVINSEGDSSSESNDEDGGALLVVDEESYSNTSSQDAFDEISEQFDDSDSTSAQSHNEHYANYLFEVFTLTTVIELEKIFASGLFFPDFEARCHLAYQFGLPEPMVKYWFEERIKLMHSNNGFGIFPRCIFPIYPVPPLIAFPISFTPVQSFSSSSNSPTPENIRSLPIVSADSLLQVPPPAMINDLPPEKESKSFHYSIPPHLLEDISDDETEECEQPSASSANSTTLSPTSI